MPDATLKDIARLAGVAPITVSRVVNGSENVAAATREKILAIVRDSDYTPNVDAARLARRRSNDENISGSNGGSACVNDRLRAGFNVSRPNGTPFVFTPEETKVLVQQLSRLRRDLAKLKKQTERLQSCVEIIQEAYSRRLPSCASH